MADITKLNLYLSEEQCIRFTGMCAGKVAEILCRELGITNLDKE